jgi:hypothetical protein
MVGHSEYNPSPYDFAGGLMEVYCNVCGSPLSVTDLIGPKGAGIYVGPCKVCVDKAFGEGVQETWDQWEKGIEKLVERNSMREEERSSRCE